MLMAGLDGIKNKIDPTQAGFGPYNEDIFKWSAEKRAAIKNLPTSLEEAMNALEGDHNFLLEGDVFEEEMLLDWIWIELKEEAPDKDAVIRLDLDDLYEIIESYADMYEDYQILLESIRSAED